MKKEIRVIGFDDGPFDKFNDQKTLVVGVVFRGGNYADGVLSTQITIDGSDATSKLIKLVDSCKFKPQLQAIFLKGIAVGGFNVIDVRKLSQKTKLPVVVVIRNYPNFEEIYVALVKLKQKNKIKLIESLPKPEKIGQLYVQRIGIDKQQTKELLKITCTHANIPEPLRVAHLIASGVVRGERKGRA